MPGIFATTAEVCSIKVRLEYQHKSSEVITLGHNRKVYAERVEPGWILTVKCCFFHVPEIGTPHVVTIYVEIGADEHVIRSRGKETGRLGMTVMCPFFVGEYQRIVGYAPNAAEGDTISLQVMGYLTPLWDWRRLS